MNILVIAAIIGMTYWMLHRLCLWMESKGWLYYKNKPKPGGGFGTALDEMNSFVRPSVKYVQEAKKKTRKEQDGAQDGY